jgi:arylsulfatase A-like enzyme/cytochrome c-type biogenesis protein CcmH/NrfG
MRLSSLLVTLAALPGCRAREEGPRSLLVVTLDTTRADRLGAYGGPADVSPRFDALAREGVLFETAFCSIPETLPSHTTLFTGLEPPAHGIRINGTPVPADLPTLAESFSSAGFATAAVVGAGVLDPGFGLRRGFDLYDRRFLGSGPGEETERRAWEVNEAALRWIEGIERDRPFFLWVHYYDPHDPYEPPPPYAERFRGREYEGEIAYADERLGALLDGLRAAGKLERTLVAVASDHGEGLGEHGEPYHSVFLYDSTVRVPLLLWHPPSLAPARVSGLARLVDLAPTLLDLLGLPPLPGASGRSLVPSLASGVVEPPAPVYLEANHPAAFYGWSALRAFRTEQWKLVLAPRRELYRLDEDPLEGTNLLDREPGTAQRLESSLRALEERLSTGRPSAAMDPEAAEALAGIGYAGSSLPAETSGKDPKDWVWEVPILYQARDLLRTHRDAEVVALLGPIAERDDTNPEVAFLLAQAARQDARLEEADRWLRRTVELRPDYANARTLLAIVAAERGDPRRAEAEFREALRRSPTYTKAKLNFAILLATQSRLGEAETLLREVVRERPNSFEGWESLAGVLEASPARHGDAIVALEKALALRPKSSDVARRLEGLRAAAGGPR